MRPLLLEADRGADLGRPLSPQQEDLVRDLQLGTILRVMGGSDANMTRVCRALLLEGVVDPDRIRYRQEILADGLARPEMIRRLYALAVQAVAGERQVFHSIFRRHPVAVLQQVVETLALFLGAFRELRVVADREAPEVHSAGLVRFFRLVEEEFDDRFLAEIEGHVKTLRFRRGVVLGAGLGPGNRLAGETLLRPVRSDGSWRARVGLADGDGYTFDVAPQDEAGTQALAHLRERALGPAAGALVEATDQVLAFFTALRDELAFYVGCLNLADRLRAAGAPRCFPDPAAGSAALRFTDLRDLALLVSGAGPTQVTGNDLEADGCPLIVVTGANQGGKSTFLRSLGLAQLLFQAGSFVPAAQFRGAPASGVFVHYARGEDTNMEQGRLEEELSRMSRIVDAIGPGGLLLCNESFAATNEREGSEIAWQVLSGLVDGGVRVVLVTHLFELASRLARERGEGTRFLRAPREDEGSARYRLEEGPPLPTGYAEDRYRQVFPGQ